MKSGAVKVVILCGGLGTRLREETEYRPKPLVEIGGRPILWHIMKIYAHYGFKHFVLCLGYKGEMIKRYFLEYETVHSDLSIELGSPPQLTIHNTHREVGWNVTLVDTGRNAMTGARVKRIEQYIDGDTFMLTYGDGVADINLKELVEFHHSHGRIGTVTGTNPLSRFGQLVTEGQQVTRFTEKPLQDNSLINGGFFVFNRSFFQFLRDDDSCILEKEPLEHLAEQGQLMVYPHHGFWHCVDTYRDLQVLNELWSCPSPPWKIWDKR